MHTGPFSRRQLILTAGLGIALPMLPSLLYSRRARAADCAPAKRFLAYMFPNGHHIPEHIPTATGSGSAWSLPPMLASMAAVKSELTFVSGLENQQRRRETGDHAIGCGALLTARKPTANQQITNMSVDQAIADAIGSCTRLPSLQLGTQNAGPTDSFGTYYTRSLSWRGMAVANADGTMSYPQGAATPLGKEIDAKKAFDRLFAGSDPMVSTAEAEKRRALRKSVLDAVVPQQAYLKARLNAPDLAKVDELFTGIRTLENELAQTPTSTSCTVPTAPGTGLDFQKQLEAMHNLMAIAFQCDITRVITFMMGDALNNRSLAFIPDVAAVGGDAGDHSVSHHSGQADLVAKFRAMVLWKQQQIAAFLGKLKGMTDSDGQPLLNNMLVFISSDLADGNRHNHDDKPILLAGRLGGLVTPDRHVRFPVNRDYTKVKTFGDFFITLLSLYGVKATAFGDDGKEAIVWDK
jgi:hypothetical protein